MNNESLDLLIHNSKVLENTGSFFTANAFRKCNALGLTLKNKKADADRINEAIEIIKESTSIFSNFRGNNLLTIAIRISLEIDMKSAFNEIEKIYIKLKNYFLTNQYLVLAAQVIYDSKNIIDIDIAVENTRKAYDHMKKNHIFLTGQEDITSAAMIAITNTNFDGTFKEIESYYTLLRDKGFWAGNNLQSLSHILVLSEGSIEEKVNRVIKLKNSLLQEDISLKGQSLPMLGIVSFFNTDIDVFASKVKRAYDLLKKEKGFGMFSLTKQIRDMIAIAVVVADNIDKFNVDDSELIINTTNNITLTVQIAIQIAATAAASAGAAAASSGS